MYCKCALSPYYVKNTDRCTRVEDSSTRYVAEENIQLTRPDYPAHALLTLAGKYFKRWDSTSHSFISNGKDEYPDD